MLVTPITGRCPGGRSNRAPHLGQTRACPPMTPDFHTILPAARAYDLGIWLVTPDVGVMWGLCGGYIVGPAFGPQPEHEDHGQRRDEVDGRHERAHEDKPHRGQGGYQPDDPDPQA